MLLGGKPTLMLLFPNLHETELSLLLILTRQEAGIASLVLALLLYFALRDPVRNVAVIYAIGAGLCLSAVHEVIALRWADADRFYSAPLTWGHALARVAVAGLLFYLRPRAAGS